MCLQGKVPVFGASRGFLVACFVLAWGAPEVPAARVDFVLADEEEKENHLVKSTDGVVALEWEMESGEGGKFVVQQARSEDFSDATVRYRGGDAATHLTGLVEGTYFFRVRTAKGEWSEPLRVDVEFIERRWLILLLTTGFVVAAVTVGAIVAGALRSKKAP